MPTITGNQSFGVTAQAYLKKNTIILVIEVVPAWFNADSLAFDLYISKQRRNQGRLESELRASQNGTVFSKYCRIIERTKLAAEDQCQYSGRIATWAQDAGNQHVGIQHDPGQILPLATLISLSIASSDIGPIPDVPEAICN